MQTCLVGQVPLSRLADPQRERHGRLLEECHQDTSPHRLPGRVAVAVNSRHLSSCRKKGLKYFIYKKLKLRILKSNGWIWSVSRTHTYSPLLQQRLDLCDFIEGVTQDAARNKRNQWTKSETWIRKALGSMNGNFKTNWWFDFDPKKII